MMSTDRSPNAQRLSAAFAFLPLLIYVTIIFYEGTSRGVGTPFDVSDKTMHAVAFGGMVVFALPATRYVLRRARWSAQIVAAGIVSSGAGALLECWQYFLPYRTADVLDWTADTVGAIVVGVALWVIGKRFHWGD
jgi:VanZ family protein